MSQTYFSPFFPDQNDSGALGSTVPVISPDQVTSITGNLSDQQDQINSITVKLQDSPLTDTIAPQVISGLTLSSSSSTDPVTGQTITTILASWNPSTDGDVSRYDIAIKENDGNYVLYTTGFGATSYGFQVRSNQTFTVKIRPVDVAGNQGPFSPEVSIVSSKDNTPPGAPTNLTYSGGINSVLLFVSGPSDPDLNVIRFYKSVDTNFSNAVPAGAVSAIAGRTVSRLMQQDPGVTVYYWATAIDTSNNEGASVGPLSTTTYSLSNADVTPNLIMPRASISSLNDSGVEGQISTFNGYVVKYTNGSWKYALSDAGNLTGQITTTQITPNSITTPLIAANAVVTNNIAAGAILAAQLSAGAVTASKIGVLGETIFPDGQIQDAYWWDSPSQVVGAVSSAPGPGYRNPAGGSSYGWFFNDPNIPSNALFNSSHVGSTGAWVLYDANYSGNQGAEQVVAPAVKGITPGEYYEVGSTLYNGTFGSNPSNRDLKFVIQWFKSDGTYISPNTVLGVANRNIGQIKISQQVQAPSNASLYRLYWEASGSGSFQGLLSFGSIFFRQAGTGSFIVDGTIVASKIAVGSLTGDRIMAGTITGDLINSASSLPATLSIANTGFSLSTIAGSTAAGMVAGVNRYPDSDFLTIEGFSLNDNPSGSSPTYDIGTYGTVRYANTTLQPYGGGNFASVGSNYQKLDNFNTYTYRFPIRGGERLSFSCLIGGNNIGLQVLTLYFADSNGNEIPNTRGFSSDYNGNPPFGSYTLGSFVTAPINAVQGYMLLYARPSDSSKPMLMTFSQPMVAGASPGQSILPAYSPTPPKNAAAAINANTTLISPGRIQLFGGTTLTNWMYGGDNTLINGGSIAANTITANKVVIGIRGVQPVDIAFDTNRNNIIYWTGGYVEWQDDNGNRQVSTINPGQATFDSNNSIGVLYVWFDRSASTTNNILYAGMVSSASILSNPDNCILALYRGGTNQTVYYGRTIIDGDVIKTGTVNADRLIANTITANKLQIGLRGINTPQLDFSVSGDGSTLSWTQGYIQYIDDNDSLQQVTINSGYTNSPGFQYIYWAQGNNQLGVTTDPNYALSNNYVNLATWNQGTKLVIVNYGGTFIDGDRITTGTIDASKIIVNTITADRIINNSLTQTVISYYAGPLTGTGTPTGAGGSGGGGGGGGSVSCVFIESILPSKKLAGDTVVGDSLYLLKEDDSGYFDYGVKAIRKSFEPCVRIETESAISLIVSESTPITTRNSTVVNVMNSLNVEVPVLDKGIFRWEKIKAINSVGFRHVALISADNGTYAAAEYNDDRYIFTHNATAKP